MPAIASTRAMLSSGHQKHQLEVGLSLPNPILHQLLQDWRLETSFWHQ
jgi:hypothetical protein